MMELENIPSTHKQSSVSRLSSLTSRIKGLPFLGLFIAVFSSLLFGYCNVIVKQLSSIDAFTIATYRFIGIALPAYPIVIARREDPFPKGKRLWLVLRCVMGSSNLIIHFYGLKHMPIADANMIASAAPIWVVIFGRIFLKESCGVFDVINIMITLSGILFIIQPPFIFGYNESLVFSSQYYMAATAIFMGNFLQATVYIMLRLLKDVHYSVTLANFGSVGAVESCIFMLFLGTLCLPACGFDRYMLVCVGLLSFLAQILLTVALQVEEAGRISLMRKAGDIMFAFIFQIFIFNDIPGLWSCLGALLVCVAVFMSGGKKLVDSLPQKHWVKQRLGTCYPNPPALEQQDQNHPLQEQQEKNS